MVKLTRIDKFRKAIRLPSSDNKNNKSILNNISHNESTNNNNDNTTTLNTNDNNNKLTKNVRFGIKVNKKQKKKIIFNKIESKIDNNSDNNDNINLTSSLSRGKRKREAKKLAFRKKFDFEKTCLEILKENKSIDKHGLALGSLKDLKSSIDLTEKKLIKVNKIGKKRNKLDFKQRLKKRNFKQWSNNDMQINNG